MISAIIELLIPVLILIFIAVKVNKNPLFLLGIPFLMIMNDALFVDKIRILSIPGSWGRANIGLIWLIFVWVVFMRFKKGRIYNWKKFDNIPGIFGKQKLELGDILVLLLLFLVIVNIIRSLRYDDIGRVLYQASSIGSMLIGYFFIRGIVANSTHDQVLDFFEFIIGINLVASLLYLLPHIFIISTYNDIP